MILLDFDDADYNDFGANRPAGVTIPADSRYLDPSKATLTRNLGQFANEGLRFTNAHSADAVCSPSWFALMTGRYTWRTRLKHGVLGGYSGSLMESDRYTIAKLFKSAGYQTARP